MIRLIINGNISMHIILMLALVLIGLSIGSNFSWLFGSVVIVGGLCCLNLGTSEWRERQENLLLFFGLVCGVVLLVLDVFRLS